MTNRHTVIDADVKRAQSLEGFDPVWLRNVVMEPLGEADVKVEQTGP